MAKEEPIEVEGTIVEPLPNAMFRVELEGGHRIRADRSGNMRRQYMCSRPGDRVSVKSELPPDRVAVLDQCD